MTTLCMIVGCPRVVVKDAALCRHHARNRCSPGTRLREVNRLLYPTIGVYWLTSKAERLCEEWERQGA